MFPLKFLNSRENPPFVAFLLSITPSFYLCLSKSEGNGMSIFAKLPFLPKLWLTLSSSPPLFLKFLGGRTNKLFLQAHRAGTPRSPPFYHDAFSLFFFFLKRACLFPPSPYQCSPFQKMLLDFFREKLVNFSQTPIISCCCLFAL